MIREVTQRAKTETINLYVVWPDVANAYESIPHQMIQLALRMLELLDGLMAWCRLNFKPKKSRSLSVRKGKVDAATAFAIANTQIPTVSEEPVNSLGR